MVSISLLHCEPTTSLTKIYRSAIIKSLKNKIMNVTSKQLLPPIDLTPQKFTDCQQIGIAIAVICMIGALLVIGIGIAGYLKVESFTTFSKTRSLIMIGSGAGTLLFIGGIGGIRYCMTQPPLLIRTPNSLKKNEWIAKLNVISPQGNYYDLTGANKVPTSIDGNHIALPTFGTYPNYRQTLISRPNLTVRLPISQLSAFPQTIQDLFKYDYDIELYVLIYMDITNPSKERNLVLHHMALSDFNRSSHSWCQCDAEVGIYDPKGIKRARKDGIPFGSTKNFKIIRHDNAVSPNNCRFEIEEGVPTSSFYTAARFRNRVVAFYSVLLHDNKSSECQIINKAILKNKLSEGIQVLEQEGSPCAEEFKKLFAYYS